MLHNLAREDVAQRLRNLTNASRLQRQGDTLALRDLGEQTYNRIYLWLEEHRIQFEYDQHNECYVEVDSDD